jgi:exodeoxyribonuclease VII large subunit
MDDTRSNIPEYTVSEISGAVKRTLEGAFGRVRVRGELTEVKRYPSGHIYFSLKDEGGKLAGVVWKFAVPKLGMLPENGVEVIAQGKVSSYGDRSSYQLIVDRMDYAGAGALLARIEALKQRLGEEGLFDAARKRALPMLPVVIGVVTSPQGAVIQDIRTTILRRFPRALLLWPVPVQGEGAADKIAAAINGFSAIVAGGPVPRPDVIIVARGGGSLEDLMAFNEEVVVRAAAACSIPLISAVGHETDTTLIDFASDRRAPTPTAAAEMAIPARAELLADLLQKAARLEGSLGRISQEKRLRLQRAERGLPDLPSLVGGARQRLDDRAIRLDLALPNLVAARRAALVRAERGLPDLAGLVGTVRRMLEDRGLRLRLALPNVVTARRGGLDLAAERLRSALRHATAGRAALAARVLPRLSDAPVRGRLREARARLEGLGARLESVSHKAVQARGYALVLDASGGTVTSAAKVRPGAALRICFADGEVGVTANGGRARQASLDL